MLLAHLGMVTLLLEVAAGARILAFFPFPAKSHHIAFQPLLYELARRGHHVDYFTAVPPYKPHENLHVIETRDVLSTMRGKMSMDSMMSRSVIGESLIINRLSVLAATMLFEQEPKAEEIIKSNVRYDVLLLETHFGQEYSAALCHKFNAPCVSMLPLFDSTWTNEMSGLPDNPSYMVDFKASTTDQMTFVEKLYNMYIWASSLLVGYYYVMYPMQHIADKYIRYEGWETRPSILELTKDMALVLVNSHHTLGYPYPKAPHVKEVGGMHLTTPKPLPKDLQAFMDSASDGVIFFSYGSNVDMKQMMSGGRLEAFLNIFKTLKHKVLWKWKDEKIPKIDNPNIIARSWFPQQDILAHNNTKLFITHGGLMSTIEAIHHGVPIIGTAVFADQLKNINTLVKSGIGIGLKYKNMTNASVAWAVNEVLFNPSYKAAVMRKSEQFNDRLMKPVEEGAYWVEYVIKHGKVLQPASVHMPFYQVYLLDVFAAILLFIALLIYLVKCIFKSVCAIKVPGNEETAVSKPKYE